MAQTASKNTEQDESLARLAGKYLTFLLGEESYGIEILKVQEIIGMQSITRIPRTPAYVKGVINLRGKVIPVIDLRLRFGMEEAEVSRKTCIIVVQVTRAEISVTMGIVVDEVSEVIEISAGEIEPPPGFGAQVETAFILGMAKTENAVKILLDIDKIMTEGEMEALAKSAG
ncbi:MAG: chemotaxis protein CheW [Desulfobacteraceae bacterium]|nr:chemotaxis protein CheW [Desulfobacteraceae bacterium]MCF8094639.1 chemotaxis protein CheW [Desulfobacteraceae bacterium]